MKWDELSEWHFGTASGNRDIEQVPENSFETAADVAVDRSRGIKDRVQALTFIKVLNSRFQDTNWLGMVLSILPDPTQPAEVRAAAVSALEQWYFSGFVAEAVFAFLNDLLP